jgi:hypothetical protein
MSVVRCLSSGITNPSGLEYQNQNQADVRSSIGIKRGRGVMLLRLRRIAVLLAPTVALAAASVPTDASAHALLLGVLGGGLFGGHGFGGGAFGHGLYNRFNGFNGYGGYNGYSGYGYNGYAGYGGDNGYDGYGVPGYAWGSPDYGYGGGWDCESWGPYGWR